MEAEQKTIAEEMARDADLLRRRFIHATRPKRPLSLKEAIELSDKMEGQK